MIFKGNPKKYVTDVQIMIARSTPGQQYPGFERNCCSFVPNEVSPKSRLGQTSNNAQRSPLVYICREVFEVLAIIDDRNSLDPIGSNRFHLRDAAIGKRNEQAFLVQ